MNIKYIICISLLLAQSFRLLSQEQGNDTIYLKSNELLVTVDTLYFGGSDSLVVLPDSVKYVITKNIPQAVDLMQDYYESLIITNKNDERVDEDFNNAANYFKAYEGKIIRNIIYLAVPILEGNVNDTSQVAFSKMGKSVNRGHVSTHDWILKQNTRLKEHSQVIPSLVSENERLIRNLPYVEDARIYIESVENYIDSVDVIVVTKDKFPYGIGGTFYDINRFTIAPYTRNFMGVGHGLATAFIYNQEGAPMMGYRASYEIDNISGWYTSALLQYENTFETELLRFNVYKPFLTNDVKYGGGLDVYQGSDIRDWVVYHPDSIEVFSSPFTTKVADAWLARSFFPRTNNYDKLINLALRYKFQKYLSRPEIEKDSNYHFHDEQLILGSISLNDLRFYKTARLFGYGVTEDIPYGKSMTITGGLQQTTYVQRYYLGLLGGIHSGLKSLGYLTINTSMASFFNEGKTEDVQVALGINYFSRFLEMGRWGLRNSLQYSFLSIENPRYLDFLNFGNQIRNLDQAQVYGLSNTVFRYEPFFYSPFSVLSFKLSLSVFGDLGFISSDAYLLGKKELYSVIGAAVHIKSESLTLPNLTIEAGFYPKTETNPNDFKVSFIFRDRGLNRYNTIGKPRLYY